jgi:hypothetical protein
MNEYPKRLAAEGVPGSVTCKDGRSHIRNFPCPTDHHRYFLSDDAHMWQPLYPDLDLKKVGKLLDAAYPLKSWSQR